MEYTLIKNWISRSMLCFLITHFTFLKSNAQDDLDIGTWYIMKVAEADKNALKYHIQSVFVSIRDSIGKRIVSKKVYDKNGYLIYRVDYSKNNKLDSIETMIKRVSSNETIVRYRFAGRNDYDVDDEDHPRLFLSKFFDTVSNKYSVLTKAYKRLSGRIVRVLTSLNGEEKGSAEFPIPNTVKQRIKYPSGDTAHIGDTIVVSKQEKVGPNVLFTAKRYFIKGIADPVKTEYLKFMNDSLTSHSVEVNEYDKMKRLVSHSVYQGPPLMRYEFEMTSYNDSTGERTETHGYNPVSGKPDLIWRYDKKGRILYFERTGVTDMENGRIVYQRDKGSAVYQYNQKGLLEKVIFSVNDVPSVYTSYRYNYY